MSLDSRAMERDDGVDGIRQSIEIEASMKQRSWDVRKDASDPVLAGVAGR
jgi:hypothetical protein